MQKLNICLNGGVNISFETLFTNLKKTQTKGQNQL